MLDKIISTCYIVMNNSMEVDMRNPVWKQTYKGRGIYWHGANHYGDETGVYGRSIAECKRLIDRLEQAELEARPDHMKYWDTLSHEDRERWRMLCITTELSAAELAYTNRAQ